ncbi:MAG: potassium/proton antiporter [Bacteroidaceae bacterium]|nr:potassium/proton antiporter [Bacteroidaceae bacterium]
MMIPLSIFNIDLSAGNLIMFISLLMFVSILVAKIGTKFGVPTMLLFLVIGMLAGEDGLGIKIENLHVAEFLGHLAMTIILLSGGLETSLKETKPIIRKGISMTTLGLALTIVITGSFIYLVFGNKIGGAGASILGCFLLSAVMSSTDSASVFSILRNSRLSLRENLGPLLELESGSNDPTAYVLTILLVQIMEAIHSAAGVTGTWIILLNGAWILIKQIALGFGMGLAIGRGARWLLTKIHLANPSLYSILILSIAMFANGATSYIGGNGLLALYISAIVIGNTPKLPCKKEVLQFYDGITWLSQLIMFLLLGLLAKPSQMHGLVWPALHIGLFLIFIARPAGIILSLLPFKGLTFRAKLLASWVGLKGAGPILFALYTVLEGVDGSSEIFNIVFCITLLSLLLQGMTLTPMAHLLNMSIDDDPDVETFGMEIPEEMGMLRDHIVAQEDLEGGETLRDLHLPHGIRVVMVRRGPKYIVPHGSLKLMVGDRLVIIMGDTED